MLVGEKTTKPIAMPSSNSCPSLRCLLIIDSDLLSEFSSSFVSSSESATIPLSKTIQKLTVTYDPYDANESLVFDFIDRVCSPSVLEGIITLHSIP